MEQVSAYSQSGLYKMSACLLVVGRFGVVALLPLLVLLSLPPDVRTQWWRAVLAGVVGTTFVAIWAGVGVALLLRCDRCGRRPTLIWTPRRLQSRPQSEWSAIRDHFYPPELRSGVFECAHCGVYLSLRSGMRRS